MKALNVARHTGRGLFQALAELGAVRMTPPRDSRAAAHRLAGALGAVARAHDLVVTVRGEIAHGPALVVSNHVSYLDPIALLPVCPAIPIAKGEVAGWPIVGPVGKAFGIIFLARRDPMARVRTLRRIHDLLAAGTPVYNFPEGTTTRGDRVLPFWRGGFGIAQRLGVPVVPVAIRYRDPALAWCDGATFVPHYLRTAARPCTEVTLAFGAPLHARTGERVGREAWDLRTVPAYLWFGFRVVDEQGAPLPGATNIGVASCTVTGITTGLHNYVVTYPHATDLGFEQVVVPVTPLINTASDYTDMWWAGESENGWGLSITQHGRAQFAVLYVYDGNGNPIWYVLPDGTWNASNTAFTGLLYQPTSSPYSSYNTANFKPGGVTGASVGNATITYTGAGTATLTYTINGVSGSKAIVRQPFATDDGAAKMQVNDMWWAGIQENGWGMNIAQQGRMLFPVWYTYETAGRTIFYTVPGGTWTGSSFTGDIYSTVSSVWLGVNYNRAQFVVTKVGTMTLDFTDQSNAVMSYTIGNVTQKKVIMRQPF